MTTTTHFSTLRTQSTQKSIGGMMEPRLGLRRSDSSQPLWSEWDTETRASCTPAGQNVCGLHDARLSDGPTWWFKRADVSDLGLEGKMFHFQLFFNGCGENILMWCHIMLAYYSTFGQISTETTNYAEPVGLRGRQISVHPAARWIWNSEIDAAAPWLWHNHCGGARSQLHTISVTLKCASPGGPKGCDLIHYEC